MRERFTTERVYSRRSKMSKKRVHRACRREFLSALAAFGAATFVGGPVIARQATGERAADSKRIDLHHHYASPRWSRRHAEIKRQGWETFQDYKPSQSLEAMDKAGIQTAYLSVTNPGVWFTDDYDGERQTAVALARDMNEFAARMVADYKGRFGLFATLPLRDIDASLREIEHAFDTLKADGVGLLTSYGNAWLGDPSFAPVLAELNRRKVVVYTHPTDSACCMNLIPRVANQMLEYPMDTTRTIASLIVGETAAKCPDVRFIFSHAGGTLIGVAGRLLGAEMTADNLAKPPAPNSRLHHLRRFYYDTAGSANPVNMQALKTLVGTSQIVFGTDAPFFDGAPQVQGLQRAGFSADELRGVERENALNLVPRFR